MSDEAIATPTPPAPPDFKAAGELLASVMPEAAFSGGDSSTEDAAPANDAPDDAAPAASAAADGESTGDGEAADVAAEQPAEETAEADAEASPDAAKDEPAVAEPVADAKEPTQAEEREPIEPWRRAMWKKRQKQLEERSRSLDDQRRAIATREQQLRELDRRIEEQARMLDGDPQRALELLARRASTTPEEFYQKLTDEQLNKGKPEYLAQQAHVELDKLKRELAAERAQRAQDDRARREDDRRKSYEAELAGNLQTIGSIPDHQEWSQQYMYLSALPRDEVVKQAREVIETAGRSNIPMTLDDVARFLDKKAKTVVESALRRFAPKNEADSHDGATARRGQEGGPANAETLQRGTGKPAMVANPVKKPMRVPSNADAAETTGKKRDMSAEERLRLAGDLLAGQIGLQ